jgi:hypothetical protein
VSSETTKRRRKRHAFTPFCDARRRRVRSVILRIRRRSRPPWGPETPPFNIEVILRDVTRGSAFGHVKFRQPNDTEKIVYLDTWVRDLAPNHAYRLQRAVDTTLDGNCPRVETDWLTLGKGLAPQVIATDDRGTGREDLFRDLAAVPTGKQFDINFRVIDAVSSAPVLESGCYRFTVDP